MQYSREYMQGYRYMTVDRNCNIMDNTVVTPMNIHDKITADNLQILENF